MHYAALGLVLLASCALLSLSVLTLHLQPHAVLSPPGEVLPPAAPPVATIDASSSGLVHIGTSTDEEEPFGLIALVNSTICHSTAPSELRFHVVVPQAAKRRLRLLLESLFPSAAFRMYSLDVGGARAKILRHLRRRDRDPVYVSPYRYVLPYLPILLPTHVRRVVWLHTDVLMLADVRPLAEVPLQGAPAAAVEDCTRPISRRFNASHPGLSGALPSAACAFDAGLVVVDVRQWALLDMTARVEYWQALNLRAAPLFAHDDAHAPLALALLPVFMPLPAVWLASGLGERAASRRAVEVEAEHAAARPSGLAGELAPPTAHPRASLPSGNPYARSGRAVSPARAVHFSGRRKPWLRGASAIGATCVLSASVADGSVAPGASLPCAELWSQYAKRAILMLGWKAPTAVEALRAATAATLAASAVGGKEDEDEPSTDAATLEADPIFAGGDGNGDGNGGVGKGALPIHVAVACNDEAPYGLIALINSTLVHAAEGRKDALRFHVITRPPIRAALVRKLSAAFPRLNVGGSAEGRRGARIAVTSAPAEKLTKLGAKLESFGISVDPFSMPLLWLHVALPADVPRVLLLSMDGTGVAVGTLAGGRE